MNIHPLIVHFPIALLSIYAVLELVSIRKLELWEPWFYIKFFFIFFGFFGGCAALLTGGFGRMLYPEARTIIGIHETFAKTTMVIFGLLGIHYGIELVRRISLGSWSLSRFPTIERLALAVNRLYVRPVCFILALVGIITLLITGALGGSIVYGASSDPFIGFVYHWLGLSV